MGLSVILAFARRTFDLLCVYTHYMSCRIVIAVCWQWHISLFEDRLAFSIHPACCCSISLFDRLVFSIHPAFRCCHYMAAALIMLPPLQVVENANCSKWNECFLMNPPYVLCKLSVG